MLDYSEHSGADALPKAHAMKKQNPAQGRGALVALATLEPKQLQMRNVIFH